MLKLAQEKELKNKSNLYPKNQKQYNKKFDLRQKKSNRLKIFNCF